MRYGDNVKRRASFLCLRVEIPGGILAEGSIRPVLQRRLVHHSERRQLSTVHEFRVTFR